MILRIIIFLLINFAALGIGSFFTNKGVPSDWYQNLIKAPWTPPGWFFGFAWTTIMICFSIYMAFAWKYLNNRNMLIIFFIIQWLLNVSWNPIFFKYHEIFPGLLIIISLSIIISYMLFKFSSDLKIRSLLILPYFLWLILASSLNLYIFIKN